jgi:hypothetical protein
VYERVWPRSRDQILSFFDGIELLEPGLVPKQHLTVARVSEGLGVSWNTADGGHYKRFRPDSTMRLDDGEGI